jgi:hypothetical protein
MCSVWGHCVSLISVRVLGYVSIETLLAIHMISVLIEWQPILKIKYKINSFNCPSKSHTVTPRITETLKKVINKWLGAVTSLNQKTEFKNKVLDSNYREINPNFLFEWNSKFWSSFDENLFFLTLRCNQELASQISSKSKFLEIFSEFLSKFNS